MALVTKHVVMPIKEDKCDTALIIHFIVRDDIH